MREARLRGRPRLPPARDDGAVDCCKTPTGKPPAFFDHPGSWSLLKLEPWHKTCSTLALHLDTDAFYL